MQTKHRNHDWCDIEDISEEKQKELERNINILENEKLPKLKEKKSAGEGQKETDKGGINRQADAMIELINKHRQALISKVDSTSASDTEAAVNMADLDPDIADVEQIIRNSKKSIAIQAKSEIVQGNENVKVVIAEVDKSFDGPKYGHVFPSRRNWHAHAPENARWRGVQARYDVRFLTN